MISIMPTEYDVFLSYNSEDRSEVLPLADELKRRGIHVWWDVWELRPGQRWQTQLERAISYTKSAAILVGGSGFGPWQDQEMQAFLMSFVDRQLPVIPVLLPGAPERIALPIFLRGFTWVDLRDGISDEVLERLIWGITGRTPTGTLSDSSGIGPEQRAPADLEEIFSTSALPTYTYVEPSIYKRVASDLRQHGKHVLLAGPSGSGKTCLIFKMTRDFGWKKDIDYQYVSASGKKADHSVHETLESALNTSAMKLVVIDDFHLLKRNSRIAVGDALKQLTDQAFAKSSVTKFVLIGISSSGEGLLFNATDLGLRLSVYKMPLATDGDLRNLIRLGEKRLGLAFLDPDQIITESANSFYLCQFLCREICLANNISRTQESNILLDYRVDNVRRHLISQLVTRFEPLLASFAKSNGPSAEQSLPILAVLAAISGVKKSLLSIHEISAVSGNVSQLIYVLKDRLASLIHACVKGGRLEKYLFYEEDSELFSVEDPIFRYYLNYLDIHRLSESLGIPASTAREIVAIKERASHKYSTGPMLAQEPARQSIFISYSHHDKRWLEELLTHLKPWVRDTSISVMADTSVLVGSIWREDAKREIDRARVVVLLVSPDFIASDFIHEHELGPLLKEAEQEEARILWLPVRASSYRKTTLKNYQAVLDPQMPLANMTKAERDSAWVRICEEIEKALKTPIRGHRI
jgi:hypothetical protein